MEGVPRVVPKAEAPLVVLFWSCRSGVSDVFCLLEVGFMMFYGVFYLNKARSFELC